MSRPTGRFRSAFRAVLGTQDAEEKHRDLLDFTDFLSTMAEISGVKPPSGVTIDGHGSAPKLRGQKGGSRKWIFCHYNLRRANFKFTRYAQDKQHAKTIEVLKRLLHGPPTEKARK